MADERPTNDDVRDAIAQSAVDGVEFTSVDGLTAREHSLDSRIRALRDLRADEATARGRRGFRVAKLRPPGTT